MEKTIREWFNELPKPYKEMAIKNLPVNESPVKVTSLREAIVEGFDWDDSPQGNDFWNKVDDYLIGSKDKLPSIPKLKKKPKANTLEDWKRKSDANRKKAEYWKNEFDDLKKIQVEEGKKAKVEIANLKQSNEVLLERKNEIEKAWSTATISLNIEKQTVRHQQMELEFLKTQVENTKFELRNDRVFLVKERNQNLALQGACNHLEKDLENERIGHNWTKVLTWVGWIFVLILLVAFILK